MLPHYFNEHPSDEEVLQSPDLKPDPDIAYFDDDTESLEALVKSEGEEPEDNGHIAFVSRQDHPPMGRGHVPEGNGHFAFVEREDQASMGMTDGPENSGNKPSVIWQQASSPGSWYDPQPKHKQLIKAAEEQDQVVDLYNIHDDADDDDDEPIIIKVESAGERERQRAARAEQELGRLQKEQLQAKFDQAVHRKDQVTIPLADLPCTGCFSLNIGLQMCPVQIMHTLVHT